MTGSVQFPYVGRVFLRKEPGGARAGSRHNLRLASIGVAKWASESRGGLIPMIERGLENGQGVKLPSSTQHRRR